MADRRHFVAHKFELAVLDGIKGVQYLADLTEMLEGLCKHYYKSEKALTELEEIKGLKVDTTQLSCF